MNTAFTTGHDLCIHAYPSGASMGCPCQGPGVNEDDVPKTIMHISGTHALEEYDQVSLRYRVSVLLNGPVRTGHGRLIQYAAQSPLVTQTALDSPPQMRCPRFLSFEPL